MSELAQRLGYDADARLVILSCDDLGSCHAANVGVYEAIRTGHATCASIMVPAPWAMHAAEMYEPTDDIGVHLTLNAEHPTYRWGPITQAPSLLGGDGGFPRTIEDVWDHADLDEVRRELRENLGDPALRHARRQVHRDLADPGEARATRGTSSSAP